MSLPGSIPFRPRIPSGRLRLSSGLGKLVPEARRSMASCFSSYIIRLIRRTPAPPPPSLCLPEWLQVEKQTQRRLRTACPTGWFLACYFPALSFRLRSYSPCPRIPIIICYDISVPHEPLFSCTGTEAKKTLKNTRARMDPCRRLDLPCNQSDVMPSRGTQAQIPLWN